MPVLSPASYPIRTTKRTTGEPTRVIKIERYKPQQLATGPVVPEESSDSQARLWKSMFFEVTRTLSEPNKSKRG